MTGGEVIARMLRVEGVEKVFGIVDGTYFGLYSSLGKYGIDLITPRHESCAAHMAGAYARLTRKLGVCIASNGPGVANILPGVAAENAEGNRVLLITSSRRTGIGYPDRGGAYQYFNQVGVIKPMAKWSGAVSSFGRISELMRRAFRCSHAGRPGVVHVDVPEDLINGKDVCETLLEPGSYRRVSPIVPDPAQVGLAAELLVAADLPLIHAGSGIVHAGAYDELRLVAEILHCPVSTSWAARGVFPEHNDRAIPMYYVALNDQVRNDADVVLALGSRIGETDWWGKAPNWRSPTQQKLIQVDVDDDMLGVNKPTTLAILGDVKLFLKVLVPHLAAMKEKIRFDIRRTAIQKYLSERRAQRLKLDRSLRDDGPLMNTAHVAQVCERFFGDEAICVIDGGNTAIWAHFYREVKCPNSILQTAKFGMLGAGIAQALGAKVACPDRQVYCIIGDGAMGFHPQEIETAIRNHLQVTYLVCCDKQWGMVKMNQQYALRPIKTMFTKYLGPGETINADLGEIRWDMLAVSMGAHGERVAKACDLRAALERSRELGRCAVIHVDVDPVKHMWAPNLLDLKKMHEEPKGK
jgi:acetolactate synthase-1/2/3 large subunit